MEQHTLPFIENSTLSDVPQSLVEEAEDEQITPSATTKHEPLDTQGVSLRQRVNQNQKRSLETLGASLRQLVNQNQKRAGRARWFAPVFYSLTLLVAILSPGELITSPLFYGSILLIILGTIGMLARADTRLRKKCKPISQMLANRNDVRAVGPLTDTLKMDYRDIYRICEGALTELLPRLQASDADLLSAEQRALLCRKLNRIPIRPTDARPSSQEAYSRAISFRISILQAFAQVGDSTALPIVEQLAQGATKTEAQKRIQEAAQACLPALRLRAEQERNDQTLLRASDAGVETLLRAAQGAQETTPDQLLRSVD